MGRRKRYRAGFKRESLRRANEPGVPDVLGAEELGITGEWTAVESEERAALIEHRQNMGKIPNFGKTP